jgi:hypothetical protein
MTDSAQKLISIYNNFLSIWPELIAIVCVVFFLICNRHQMSNRVVRVSAWVMLMAIGGLFRMGGWWAPALYLSPADQAYHPWMIQHRWISYVVGTPLLTIGLTGLLVELFYKWRRQIWAALIAGAIVSGLITYDYYRDVTDGSGYRDDVRKWFDRVFPHEQSYERVIIKGDEE